jgi:hypothetical protein
MHPQPLINHLIHKQFMLNTPAFFKNAYDVKDSAFSDNAKFWLQALRIPHANAMRNNGF